MKADRYTKVVLTLIAVALWTIVLTTALSPATAVAGPSQGPLGSRNNPVYVEGCD